MIKIVNNNDGTFDLIDEELNLKITNENYSNIRFENGFFIIEKDKKIEVLSNDGNTKLISDCDSIFFCSNVNFIVYEIDSLFGIFNCNGNSLNPICSSVTEVDCSNEDGSTTFIIDILDYQAIWNSKSGMYNELFLSLSYIGKGLIKYRKGKNSTREDRKNQLSGLMNLKGDILFEKKYTRIYSFPEIDRVIIDENDDYSILDYQLTKIGDGFSLIYGFYEGASVAIKNKQCGLIDIYGNWISGYDNLDYANNDNWWAYYYTPLQNGFIPIKRNGLYGLVNFNKKLFLDPISINEILFYVDGFIPITLRNGCSGIMDHEFNWVLEPSLLDFKFCFESYNDVEDFITSIGLPFIAKSPETNKYGLISYDGKWLCEPKYDKIIANDYYDLPHKYLFYLKFEQDEFKGIINIHGKEIFKEKIEFRRCEGFNEFEFEIEDFGFDISCNYMKLELPESHVYFLVNKENEEGYFDAMGRFFLGNPNLLNF